MWNLHFEQDRSHIHTLIVVMHLIFSLCLRSIDVFLCLFHDDLCMKIWLKHIVDLFVLLCSSRLCMWMSCSSKASADTVLDMYLLQIRIIMLWLRVHWIPSYVFICGIFISHRDSLFAGPFHGMSIFPTHSYCGVTHSLHEDFSANLDKWFSSYI